ncbi:MULTISPECIES: ATP-binding protein [Streptomyces]
MTSAFPAPQDGIQRPAHRHPAAVTAPILRELQIALPDHTNVNLLALVRITGRTSLTMLCWRGNQVLGVQVLQNLVDNAVKHALAPGQSGADLSAFFRVTEAHELIVDVIDPNPTFPEFDRAAAEESERGLGLVQKAGGALSWFLTPQADAKIVRAVLPPGPEDP